MALCTSNEEEGQTRAWVHPLFHPTSQQIRCQFSQLRAFAFREFDMRRNGLAFHAIPSMWISCEELCKFLADCRYRSSPYCEHCWNPSPLTNRRANCPVASNDLVLLVHLPLLNRELQEEGEPPTPKRLAICFLLVTPNLPLSRRERSYCIAVRRPFEQRLQSIQKHISNNRCDYNLYHGSLLRTDL
jgi:hypothetical protein